MRRLVERTDNGGDDRKRNVIVRLCGDLVLPRLDREIPPSVDAHPAIARSYLKLAHIARHQEIKQTGNLLVEIPLRFVHRVSGALYIGAGSGVHPDSVPFVDEEG